MEIVGYNYQQERSFDVMDSAAGNPGGGSALIGAGVGMGLAAPMGNAASAISQNMRISTMTPEPAQKKCPHCGSENVDYLTRIIGYMKRVSNFSAARQVEASKRYYAPGKNVSA